MITLNKTSDKDFVVLNISDPQLSRDEWVQDHPNRNILENTLKELVRRAQPQLITVSGDLSWAGHTEAYEHLANFLDSLQIPWAPIWGNHDQQQGPEFVDSIVYSFQEHPYCLYETGDKALGSGNYVIAIREGERVVEGIVMMNSHDRAPYCNEEGKTIETWAKLTPQQLVWYQEQVEQLREMGCNDTTMILHIPIYAYRTAFKCAFAGDGKPGDVNVAQSYTSECWNEGFGDSFGVCHEEIASYPEDEGAFECIKALGSTKTVLCGHDHVNNFVIRYQGVTLAYSLKLGSGCYWDSQLNGGTVLHITDAGVSEVYHEYVTPNF